MSKIKRRFKYTKGGRIKGLKKEHGLRIKGLEKKCGLRRQALVECPIAQLITQSKPTRGKKWQSLCRIVTPQFLPQNYTNNQKRIAQEGEELSSDL